MKDIISNCFLCGEHSLHVAGTEEAQVMQCINCGYTTTSKFIGTKERSAVISFNLEGVHHQDMAMFLDAYGIATRPGHHCTQMLHRQIGWSGSCRISTGVYSTKEEVDYQQKNEVNPKPISAYLGWVSEACAGLHPTC